jgi:phenylalanyl-tRNA synthetase alpha chain
MSTKDFNQSSLSDFAKSITQVFDNCQSISQCLKERDLLNNTGEISLLKNQLSQITDDKDRKIFLGKLLNEFKQVLKEISDTRIQSIQTLQEQDSFTTFDPTFYSSNYSINETGNLHPINLISKQVMDIFANMGFDIFTSPLVETQWNNFTVVNIPKYHPARAMQDTFFLEQKDGNDEYYVMRTQTTAALNSYVQKQSKPPYKFISPGLVFRAENIDATHDINFHQLEMWYIDKTASISQLTTIIERFFQEFFEDKDLKMRLRPSYFPFTEPSFEGDIYTKWFKGGQWVEVFGAGLAHTQVIKNLGLDPSQWQGIAFGFGLTRLAQLKLQISGLSHFYDGKVEFLKGM